MKSDLRKTKIVCTIGPASESEERLTALMKAGMNVTRINFSHGGYAENATKVDTIKKVRENLGVPVALLLDTKGPEIRTGKQESGDAKVKVEAGTTFTLVNEEIIGNETKTSVSYKELYKDVTVGSTILIDDGAIELKVKEIKDKDIVCDVVNSGMLGSRKSINVPGVKLELPALTQKDIDDITNGIKAGFDYIAASFVRKASDVLAIRKLLDDNGGKDVKIISKIENQEGLDNFEEILELSDGIMVARGDLGVEIPLEEVPVVQKHFIKRCNKVGKPVITATQMLETMTQNPRPTRAEVSDVANAVYDRTGAIMLSGECAMGKYPVECVETMVKISKRVEKSINYWRRFEEKAYNIENDREKTSAHTVCKLAETMKADAIVAYTHTGNTARRLAGMGPACPILVVTDNERTYNQLSLVWNVTPVYVKDASSIEEVIEKGIQLHKEAGNVEVGDSVVVTGGRPILPNYPDSKVVGGVVVVK